MNKILPAVATVLATSLGLTFSVGEAMSPVPVPGPGGVAAAVRGFLQALDGGGDVGVWLADEGHAVDLRAVEGGGIDVVRDAKVACFHDVGADGEPFAANTAEQFARVAVRRVAGATGRLSTELGTIRAACDSERCSWAVFTFTRTYAHDGRERRVPMRGSALLRYCGGERPGFEIYHWHASRAGAAPQPVGGDAGGQVR